jgi:TonB family protein
MLVLALMTTALPAIAQTKRTTRPGSRPAPRKATPGKETAAPAKPEPPPAPQPETEQVADFATRPIFLNVNLFQLEVDAAADPELTDQIFKMKTSSLQDYEKWIRTFGKTYPGHPVSLLKLESRRVFRTAKPTMVSMTRQVDGRSMVLEINGAQSPGDGVIPGTSLVTILNLQFGNDQLVKPVTYSITPMEVEHGMTYFYLVKQLRLNSLDYVRFLRPNEAVDNFTTKNYYVIVAISVDLDQTYLPPRYYDERQAVSLQEEATKKAPLVLPATIEKAGLSGMIRVKVDVSPEGRVSRANIAYSTLPEANQEAITAARQWEFPPTLFATDQNPITTFITFTVPPKKP